MRFPKIFFPRFLVKLASNLIFDQNKRRAFRAKYTKHTFTTISEIRNSLLSKYIDLESSSGLEIGPLHAPQVDSAKCNIKYADLQKREELVNAYKDDPNVCCDKIPNIDYVTDSTLPAATIHEKFDYIVANHVLEHCPNPILYMMELSKLLHPGGILFMAIPDKRFTFDKGRPLTTFDHLVDDYLRSTTNLDPTHVFESKRLVDFPQCDLVEVFHRTKEAVKNKHSTSHIHYHVFSCEPFRIILRQILALGLLDFEYKFVGKLSGKSCEFYMVLKKYGR